jgi:23S rRNA (cytidine1920-2'-O)/16S rRNA (cytidine1409-2'-O)-methyltransferase
MKKNKERLDNMLFSRGLALSVIDARSLIMSNEVIVDGQHVTQVGTKFNDDISIKLRQKKQFVSRGGIKLEHALNVSDIKVLNKNCLDVGSSTGGFTDCLLQRNANSVVAIDTGYGQAADKIRNDSRGMLSERTNARYMEPLEKPANLVVIDVSFISILKIIPNVLLSLETGADIIALVKPQFELPKKMVKSGGVVTSHLLHAQSVAKIVIKLIDQQLQFCQVIRSPIKGASGNSEFFIWMKYEN